MFVAGCGVELVLYSTLGALALVTAPVWVPVQHVNAKNGIVQPAAVVNQRGTTITPDYGVDPAGSFQIGPSTVTCVGVHDIAETADSVRMECDQKLAGLATFAKFTVESANLELGPASQTSEGPASLPKTLFSCSGNYDVQSGFVASFLIECGENGEAVIAEAVTKDGSPVFKVWINPPT
jgi:hypothetical protein